MVQSSMVNGWIKKIQNTKIKSKEQCIKGIRYQVKGTRYQVKSKQ